MSQSLEEREEAIFRLGAGNPLRRCTQCLLAGVQTEATRIAWLHAEGQPPAQWYQCGLPHGFADEPRFREQSLAEFWELVRGGIVAEALQRRAGG